MEKDANLRVAVLVDLEQTPQAGGHVKCWERLIDAAPETLPLDLTVYFSGFGEDKILSPKKRFLHLPPVFSTNKLKFLPYIPDHTDIAPYHPRLARELLNHDLIHSTDGFFAFAATAAKVSAATGIPLTNSFHTDTPNYARIFTHHAIERIFGHGWLGQKMIHSWRIPERQGLSMERRLKKHLLHCSHAFVTRTADHGTAESILPKQSVHHMRRGVDKMMFGAHRRDRTEINHRYGIEDDRLLVLFVGRVDIAKNIMTLSQALAALSRQNYPYHLLVAGLGPGLEEVRRTLGANVSTPGFVEPDELAKLYASADLLAVPSEVEIHSMVGVEALASGCPTFIASKSGVAQLFDTSALEIIESGIEPWIQALQRFADRPQLRAQMSKAAEAYCLSHIASWRDVIKEDLFPVWQAAAMKTYKKAA